jgi:3-oxoacyl-[acyl-carrier protein] reductase
MPIKGRYALVTGTSSGMGYEIAKLFASEGAIVACCDINTNKELIQSITSNGGRAKSFTFDASSKTDLITLTKDVLLWTNNKLDILINNAGVSTFSMLDDDDETYEKAWDFCFDINVRAQQRLSRLLLPQLIESQYSGRIVNVASTEGLGATIFNSPYVASKHASVGLTKAMAVELASRNVTVNCICPGPIRTSMTSMIPNKQKELFAKRLVPMRRYGNPKEVAYMHLALVDDRATFTNGTIVNVDGGMLANNALLPYRLPWEKKVQAKL